MDKSTILAAIKAAKPKLHPVVVEDWNTTVYLKSITLREVEEAKSFKETDTEKIVDFFSRITFDENGNQLFESAEEKQLLLDKDFPVIKKILEEYTLKNFNLTPEMIAEAKKKS